MPSSLRLPSSTLGPLLLTACIPQQLDRQPTYAPAPTPTPPPSLGADAATAQLAEPEPVWTAQQVVANARTVPESRYVAQPGDRLAWIDNRTDAGTGIMPQANGLTPT